MHEMFRRGEEKEQMMDPDTRLRHVHGYQEKCTSSKPGAYAERTFLPLSP